MSYMTEWLGWTARKTSDGEIIARMHVDPFFRRWFEKRRAAQLANRRPATGPAPASQRATEPGEGGTRP
jgi:hypothetical protein